MEERSIFRLTSDQLPPWMPIPSFALEVVRRSAPPSSPPPPVPRAGPPATPPGVAAMIRQVQEVLPQVPREAIRAEVMRTSRVEVAIEALLTTRKSHHRSISLAASVRLGRGVSKKGFA